MSIFSLTTLKASSGNFFHDMNDLSGNIAFVYVKEYKNFAP